MDIEQTLKEYRNLKANTKKNSVNNDKIVSRSIVKVVKEKIYVLWTILKEILSYCFPQNLYDAKDILNNQRKLNEQGNILKSTSDQSGSCNKTFSWLNLSHLTSVRFFLLCILWTVLWLLFINLEFGAVYFVLSLLFIMYKSTSTRTDRYAPSAYSVFNPNCERLDGTFTSEQFEKELRYGANSVS